MRSLVVGDVIDPLTDGPDIPNEYIHLELGDLLADDHRVVVRWPEFFEPEEA